MADGRVLLAGNGRTNAEIYDSATGRWRATASMPDARTNNVIVGLRDGRVLVANGDDYIFGTPPSTACVTSSCAAIHARVLELVGKVAPLARHMRARASAGVTPRAPIGPSYRHWSRELLNPPADWAH